MLFITLSLVKWATIIGAINLNKINLQSNSNLFLYSKKYPGVEPMVCINPKIVAAKFGAISWGFCKDVIDTAPPNPSARDINVIQTYGRLLTNRIPIRKPAGIKWAICKRCILKYVYQLSRNQATTYKILKIVFLLHSDSIFSFERENHRQSQRWFRI